MKVVNKELNIQNKNGRLSLGTKLGYGIGAIADNAVYNFIVSFLSFFLTTMAGVQPAVAGTIISLAIVWDAITDPLIGLMIDHSKSKNGKRRPFILKSIIPMGAAIVLLFLNVNFNSSLKTMYYLILVLVFWTSYTVFNIPYYSLGASLTPNDDERTELSSLRQGLGYIGIFCGSSLATYLVGFFIKSGIKESTAWTFTAIAISIIVMGTIFVMWICTNGKENIEIEEDESNKDIDKKEKFKRLFSILSFRPYLIIVISAFCACVAFTFFESNMMYFTTYILGIDETKTSILYTAMTVFGIISIPIMAWGAKKFDKRNVYIGSMIFSGVVMVLYKFIGISSISEAILYIAFFNVGYSAYWIFIFNLLYDVTDVDEFKRSKREDGVIFSYYSFLLKLGGAGASLVLGIVLQINGFNADALVQSDSALECISSLFTILPGIFMILGGLAIIFFPLTRKKMDLLQVALKAKNQGEKYSTDGFEDILK